MTADPVDEPSLDGMTRMAEQALAAIPAPFLARLNGVAIRVLDLAEPSMLHRVGVEHPLRLLGLYTGVPFGRRSVAAVVQHVDAIYLFRRPILVRARQLGAPVEDVVRHVLVHEIGHHFGLSDADMKRIEDAP